jgi:hypothetical protein
MCSSEGRAYELKSETPDIVHLRAHTRCAQEENYANRGEIWATVGSVGAKEANDSSSHVCRSRRATV